MILDECQALSFAAPAFWADLQGIWDLERDDARIMLIFSGPSSEGMKEIFENARAPLFGRCDLSLSLRSFQPHDLREIFLENNPDGTPADLLTLFSTTRGVPAYVSHLIDSTPLTREGIVGHVFSESGRFLRTDAEDILDRCGISDSCGCMTILRRMAFGAKLQSEFDESLCGENMAECWNRLEKQCALIKRVAPLITGNHREAAYVFTDSYFRFWFRFIEPLRLQADDARPAWPALKDDCLRNLEAFEAQALRDWFLNLLGASPRWTLVSPWRDRNGENELDLVAINELTGRFAVFDVVRDPLDADPQALASKAKALLNDVPVVEKQYGFPELRILSLNDLFVNCDEL